MFEVSSFIVEDSDDTSNVVNVQFWFVPKHYNVIHIYICKLPLCSKRNNVDHALERFWCILQSGGVCISQWDVTKFKCSIGEMNLLIINFHYRLYASSAEKWLCRQASQCTCTSDKRDISCVCRRHWSYNGRRKYEMYRLSLKRRQLVMSILLVRVHWY